MADTVEISILNQKFHLKKGKADEAYIRSIADYVDSKMKEIQSKTQSVATANIAILAALNIADEYLKKKTDYSALTGSLRKEVEAVIALIDKELHVQGQETGLKTADAR